MVHSILTSRVLLHIRAQAGNNPVWSDGLTDLTTIDFYDCDNGLLNRQSQNNGEY